MKTTYLKISAVLLITASACKSPDTKETISSSSDSSIVTETTSTPTAPMLDSAAMAKAWENYMTPGSMHKLLAEVVGKWDGEITTWMGPNMPASEPAKLTAEMNMLLGGRYLESVYKGNMMGMPFEGKGISAYDNATQMFQDIWIDNMGTGIMRLEGKFDEATKTVTYKGKMTDAAVGKEVDVKQIVTFGDKIHTMQMFGYTPDGTEFKSMEIKMTKSK